MENQINVAVDRLYRFENGGQLKAFADIIIGGQFSIKGFRVVDGKKGLFVSMPSEAGKDGKWYKTVLPLNREVMDKVEKLVLEAYGG